MGARGPLRIPNHLQAVPDTVGSKPSAQSAADRVRLAAPRKPADLPESVSEAWDAIVPTLNEAGMLSPADGASLELALRHYVQARQASDELIGATSVVIRDEKNGRDAKHPASQIMRDHSAEFLKYATQLGLTFTARARVAMTSDTSDQKPSPFA